MGRLDADGTNYNAGTYLIYIIKYAELPDSQFPYWLFVLPRGLQAFNNLLISSGNRGRISELFINLIEHDGPISRGESSEVICDTCRVFNNIHRTVAALSTVSQRHGDRLRFQVCLQTFFAQLATVAGHFVTAEGGRGVEDVVAVDPHRAGAELRR